MSKRWKIVMTTAAVFAALASGPGSYAYADTPSSQGMGGMMQGGQGDMMKGNPGGMMQGGKGGGMAQGNQGGMMQGGQGDMMGMMNMMGQMAQMMGTCNNMMKGMTQDHGSGTPKNKSPENKDPSRP